MTEPKTDDRARKQEFLRTEILEAGIEQDEFVEYCTQLKGDDVDLWTFDELVKVVEDFKAQIVQTSRQVSYTEVDRIEEGRDFTIPGRVANVTQLSGVEEFSCKVTE